MKKVLITGGAGFIGLALARLLASKQHEVHILDNFSRAVEDEELSKTAQLDNVELITCDVLQKDQLNTLDKDYDRIYHLAAIIGVQHVLNRPFDVLTLNVEMLANMLEFAKMQAKLDRFLFASTSEAYAGTLQYFDLPVPTPEETPLACCDLDAPRTSYMLSKIYGEAMCRQSGVPYTIFRPHNIYGPRMGLSHVIPQLMQKAYNTPDGESIEVYSLDHKRAFCYIDDAVNLLWAMADSQECLNQVYNLGNQDDEVFIEGLAKSLLVAVGKELTIKGLPATPGSPSRRCPDMSKLTRHTGETAAVNLEQGLRKTFDWYKPVFDGEKLSAN